MTPSKKGFVKICCVFLSEVINNLGFIKMSFYEECKRDGLQGSDV